MNRWIDGLMDICFVCEYHWLLIYLMIDFCVGDGDEDSLDEMVAFKLAIR